MKMLALILLAAASLVGARRCLGAVRQQTMLSAAPAHTMVIGIASGTTMMTDIIAGTGEALGTRRGLLQRLRSSHLLSGQLHGSGWRLQTISWLLMKFLSCRGRRSWRPLL